MSRTSTDKLSPEQSAHRRRMGWLASHLPRNPTLHTRPPALPSHDVIDRWWNAIGKDRRTRLKIMYAAVTDHAPPGSDFARVVWWSQLRPARRKAIRAKYEKGGFFDDVADFVTGPVAAAVLPVSVLPIQAALKPKETWAKYGPAAKPVIAAAATAYLGPAGAAAVAPALSLVDRAARGDLSAQNAIQEVGKAALAQVPQAQAAAAMLEQASEVQHAAAAAQRLAGRTDAGARRAISTLAKAARKGAPQARQAAAALAAAQDVERRTAPSSALLRVISARLDTGDRAALAFVRALAQSSDPAAKAAIAELGALRTAQQARGQWQQAASGGQVYVPAAYIGCAR